jgi:argininosuccinate synthase
VAIDQQAMDLVPLIAHLNQTVGAYQIGRYSGLEHLAGGEKVLEVREAPAATILMDAYRHIETAALDAELLREKVSMELLWTREAVEGRWFAPLRESADAFIRKSAEKVTGTVRYTLRQGAMDIASIRARKPLYLTDRDAWEKALVLNAFAPPARPDRTIREAEVAV